VATDATNVSEAAEATATNTPTLKARKKAKMNADARTDKGMSCLDAAAQILKDEGRPLKCGTLIDLMRERGLWTTAAATLYSAMLREIVKKGVAARFRKADRGLFELAKE
jgi:hypothetical protein